MLKLHALFKIIMIRDDLLSTFLFVIVRSWLGIGMIIEVN
jgi:hypothetical protein